MRHEEPVWLKEWRITAASIPKVCHTCDNYNGDGLCTKFEMTPPQEFAETKSACEDWEMEIGF